MAGYSKRVISNILVNNAVSSSYNLSSSYALTASYALNGGGGGGTPGGSPNQVQYNNAGAFGGVPKLTYDGTNLRGTGSFTGSFTGLFVGSISNAVTASYAFTASYIITAQTASYVLNAISASYAKTASYVNPLNQFVFITGGLNINNQNAETSLSITSGSMSVLTVTGSGITVFGKFNYIPSPASGGIYFDGTDFFLGF